MSGKKRFDRQKRRGGSAKPSTENVPAPAENIRGRIITLTILVGLVAACVVAAHRPALSAGAKSFDDSQYLTENYLVQNPSWASAKRFLCEVMEPSTVQGYYQPFAMISLMLDCAGGGNSENLRPLHRTSLILHAANTVLLILLLYSLFRNPVVAAMAGLLFGLHPMTVETICWVGERKTLLSAFFALCCMLSYIRYAHSRKFTYYLLTAGLYILALMSKPTATPLPMLLLILDYWPLNRLSRKTILEKIPLFAIAAVSAIVTVLSQAATAVATMPGGKNPLTMLLTLCHNIVFYPAKILFPVHLSSHYPFPEPMTLANPVLLGCLGATIVLAAVLIISVRRSKAFVAGWLFFFVATLPTMGIIGFTNVIAADKFAYLPAVGFILILAWGGVYLSKYLTRKLLFVAPLILLLAAAETLATRRYITHWKDTETLLTYMLALAPDAAVLHNGLGLYLFEQGKTEQAIDEYRRALELNDNDVEAHNHLGVALAEQGGYGEAVVHYQKAAKLRPNYFLIYNNLGNALGQQNRFNEALNAFQKAIAIKPLYPAAHYNLGNLFERAGSLREAERHYRQAIKINPRYKEAYNNLGGVLCDLGEFDGAIAAYRCAIEIDPSFAKAHYNIATALEALGRTDEAEKQYRQAIQINDDYFDAHNNLAVLFAKQGRLSQAVEHFTEALRIKPNDADTMTNLGIAHASLRQTEKAVEYFELAIKNDPENAEAYYNLALCLVRSGKKDQAVEYLRKTLELNPTHEQARRALNEALAE